MARPALVVVYDNQQRLAALDQALQRRFGADYQILAAAAPAAALDTLRRLRLGGKQVALVLADQWLAGMTGVEFLCQAHELHPTASGCCSSPMGMPLVAPPSLCSGPRPIPCSALACCRPLAARLDHHLRVAAAQPARRAPVVSDARR